jgi:hypothetical protein
LTEAETPHWRSDIDALAFQPADHLGFCVIHRRAFRTLLKALPSPQQCLDFYFRHHRAFQAAAREKMGQKQFAATANFHLNSRDIRRQLRMEVALSAKTG